METTKIAGAGRGLTESEARALVTKMEAFYEGLSPEEQAHVNLALRRMVDGSADVTGHAVLAEYALLLASIIIPLL